MSVPFFLLSDLAVYCDIFFIFYVSRKGFELQPQLKDDKAATACDFEKL